MSRAYILPSSFPPAPPQPQLSAPIKFTSRPLSPFYITTLENTVYIEHSSQSLVSLYVPATQELTQTVITPCSPALLATAAEVAKMVGGEEMRDLKVTVEVAWRGAEIVVMPEPAEREEAEGYMRVEYMTRRAKIMKVKMKGRCEWGKMMKLCVDTAEEMYSVIEKVFVEGESLS